MYFRDINISENFRLAKPVAILVVVASHYMGGLLWVPTVIALFLFGFSSGFFTASRYSKKLSLGEFWRSKFFRLVPRLVVINFFLFILFVWQGREGLFSWHTLPNLLGLSGFLNWLSIENQSPFGMGLWFFTVLLLFYVVYPIVFFLKNTRYGEESLLFLVLVLGSYMQFHVKLGYQIWPTVIAFFVGAYYAKQEIHFKPPVTVGLGTIVFVLVLVLNVKFNYPDLNYYFLLLLSVLVATFLVSYPVSTSLTKCGSWLDCCVLEIYFVHTYLFIHPSGLSRMVGLSLSIFLIISVSYTLSLIGTKFEKYFSRVILVPRK